LQKLKLPELEGELVVEKKSDVHIHVLTHQRVMAKFWHVSLPVSATGRLASELGVTFFDPAQTEDLPKPVLINKYLNEFIF
jgi:A/G-specific adenine glycosylase